MDGHCSGFLIFLDPKRLSLLLHIRHNPLAKCCWVCVDDHGGVEGFFCVFFQEFNQFRSAVDWGFNAVVGGDSHQAEAECGVDAFFVRPLRGGEGEWHFVEVFLEFCGNSCENTGASGVVDAFADVPYRRHIRG